MTNRYDLLPNERKHVEDTMRLARLLRVIGWLALAAIVCLFLLARMDNTKPAGAQEWCDNAGTIECPTTTTSEPPAPTTTTLPPCEEDGPCFDCETMGNLACSAAELIPPLVIERAEPVVVAPAFTG